MRWPRRRRTPELRIQLLVAGCIFIDATAEQLALVQKYSGSDGVIEIATFVHDNGFGPVPVEVALRVVEQ